MLKIEHHYNIEVILYSTLRLFFPVKLNIIKFLLPNIIIIKIIFAIPIKLKPYFNTMRIMNSVNGSFTESSNDSTAFSEVKK